MSEWQPRETAPGDGTKFLAFTAHGDIEIGEFYTIENWEWVAVDEAAGLFKRVPRTPTTGWNCNYFTHWMPLPEPPSSAGGKP